MLWDVCVFVLVTDWALVGVTGVSDSLSVRERETEASVSWFVA